MTCVSAAGSQYTLSTTIRPFSNTVITVYTCIELHTTESSPYKYLVLFVTPEEPGTSERFTSNIDLACVNTEYISPVNTVVVLQNASEANALTTLPNVIRGTYSVNYTDVDGTDVTGSSLDSCSDVTIMNFNRSDSARSVGFSNCILTYCKAGDHGLIVGRVISNTYIFGGFLCWRSSVSVRNTTDTGLLLCLYSVQEGSLYHVFTYNNESSVDGSSTRRFACWVFSYSTLGVVGTVYPGSCQTNQNATSVLSSGQTFTFIPSYVCPAEVNSNGEDDDELSTALIIVIVLLCCLLVGIIIITIVCYFKHSGKPTTSKKVEHKETKSIKAEKFSTVSEIQKNNSKTNKDAAQREASASDRRSDGPMTRWSKTKHRKRLRLEMSKSSRPDHSSTVQPEAPPLYRRMYVSMAPTSLGAVLSRSRILRKILRTTES